MALKVNNYLRRINNVYTVHSIFMFDHLNNTPKLDYF